MSISPARPSAPRRTYPGQGNSERNAGSYFVVRQGFDRSDTAVGGYSHKPSRMLKNYCGPEEPGLEEVTECSSQTRRLFKRAVQQGRSE